MKISRFASFAWTSCALAALLLSATTGRAQNVIAWGDNSQGQTNVPPSATNVIAVAAEPRTAWVYALTVPFFVGARSRDQHSA